MRIAVDLTSLADNLSGIERYALNMALELLKLNTEDEFDLVFKGEVYPDFLDWVNRPEVHFHVLRPCRKLLFNQWRLPLYLNRLKADRYLFLAFPMPVLLCRKHVYGTIHDMGCVDCPETMKRQMAWYFRMSYWWMARRAERILTISRFSKGRIMELLKVPEEKIVVAYCGLSENFRVIGRTGGEMPEPDEAGKSENARIRKKYHLPERYYLCLSTLEPRKNMLFLLDVYLRLYQEGKVHTPLVLAGRRGWKIDELLARAGAAGNEKSQETGFAGKMGWQVQTTGLEDQPMQRHDCAVTENRQMQTTDFAEVTDQPVRVTGFIEDGDLPAVYRMAACFVFPSIYEGFGIPPLEAMSQGVPVIASDASSMPEVLGGAVIYFRNNDADDLRQALLQMEQHRIGDLEQRVEAGLCRSREFSYEREAEKVREALHGTEDKR